MVRYLLLVVWLLYLISPYDILPDVLGLLGRIDDIALGLYLLYRFRRVSKSDASDASTEGRKAAANNVSAEHRDPFEVLGVESNADEKVVRKAYREEMARYHPDKVAHLGKELQALAHEKTLQLQKAFEEVGRIRGFKS